jgi:uncharacterized protein YbcI
MISTATVQLLNEYTGRGPTRAKTRIDGDLVTVLLADTLTKAMAAASCNSATTTSKRCAKT